MPACARLLLVVLIGCYNTNQPNNFGKSIEQPPEKKIERTPKQWCLDYCNRLRNCWDNGKDGMTADGAFNDCKAKHHGCDVDKKDAVLCCAELTSCGDFFQCSKEGAPAGC
jgi:hypothetical protein